MVTSTLKTSPKNARSATRTRKVKRVTKPRRPSKLKRRPLTSKTMKGGFGSPNLDKLKPQRENYMGLLADALNEKKNKKARIYSKKIDNIDRQIYNKDELQFSNIVYGEISQVPNQNNNVIIQSVKPILKFIGRDSYKLVKIKMPTDDNLSYMIGTDIINPFSPIKPYKHHEGNKFEDFMQLFVAQKMKVPKDSGFIIFNPNNPDNKKNIFYYRKIKDGNYVQAKLELPNPTTFGAINNALDVNNKGKNIYVIANPRGRKLIKDRHIKLANAERGQRSRPTGPLPPTPGQGSLTPALRRTPEGQTPAGATSEPVYATLQQRAEGQYTGATPQPMPPGYDTPRAATATLIPRATPAAGTTATPTRTSEAEAEGNKYGVYEELQGYTSEPVYLTVEAAATPAARAQDEPAARAQDEPAATPAVTPGAGDAGEPGAGATAKPAVTPGAGATAKPAVTPGAGATAKPAVTPGAGAGAAGEPEAEAGDEDAAKAGAERQTEAGDEAEPRAGAGDGGYMTLENAQRNTCIEVLEKLKEYITDNIINKKSCNDNVKAFANGIIKLIDAKKRSL